MSGRIFSQDMAAIKSDSVTLHTALGNLIRKFCREKGLEGKVKINTRIQFTVGYNLVFQSIDDEVLLESDEKI